MARTQLAQSLVLVACLILSSRLTKSQDAGNASTQRSSDAGAYFQPGTPDGEFLASYLNLGGEPSLFEAVRDSRLESYRLTWISSTGRLVAVRLAVKSDGSGEFVCQVASGSPIAVRKSRGEVSSIAVQTFLGLADKASFWSMRSIAIRPETDTQPKITAIDGTTWLLEGVRSGSYHYVHRRSPDPSFFTEVGRYLAKDIAGLKDSDVFIATYDSQSK